MTRKICRIVNENATIRTLYGTTNAQFKVSKDTIVNDLFTVVEWLGSLNDADYQIKSCSGLGISFRRGDAIGRIQGRLWDGIPYEYVDWFSTKETDYLLFEVVKMN